MTRPLVWFRSDLRTHDNPALYHACLAGAGRTGKGVVAAFLVADAQWAAHDWGDPKANFTGRSANALRDRLARLHIPLVITRAPAFSDASAALLALARRHACTGLWFNNEHELNESRRDAAVAAAFTSAGLTLARYTDQLLFAPGSVLTAKGTPYTVFTPFKNAWLKALAELTEGERSLTLPAPRRQAALPCDSTGDALALAAATFSAPPQSMIDGWPAGEPAALSRLKSFTARALATYHAQRDLAAEDGTSRLSPHLDAGTISPHRCLQTALDHGGLVKPGPAAWITELIWREFYRHLLVHFPRLSMGRPFQLDTARLRWRHDPAGFAAWQMGRTGFPIVDAGMRQLAATGWMHNRLRMVTAMFLTKDLLIHWREGERHFMRSLVDADLASNNGGWQWSASTGTDAAPYFRIFNPVLQSRKVDPVGAYIRRWVPELGPLPDRDIHDPSDAQRSAIGYPAPMLNHAAAKARAIAAFKTALAR